MIAYVSRPDLGPLGKKTPQARSLRRMQQHDRPCMPVAARGRMECHVTIEALRVRRHANPRVQVPQRPPGGERLALANARIAVQNLPIEIRRLAPVRVTDRGLSHAGSRDVRGGGAHKPADARNEHG